jgi:hypothetical protein
VQTDREKQRDEVKMQPDKATLPGVVIEGMLHT